MLLALSGLKILKTRNQKLSRKCIKQLISTQAKCKDDKIQGKQFFAQNSKQKFEFYVGVQYKTQKSDEIWRKKTLIANFFQHTYSGSNK